MISFEDLENSQENTCVRVLVLVKLQAEKFLKFHKKTPFLESHF